MNTQEFITNIPNTTRDRDSRIKEAINDGKVYISLINKNDKKHFKIYFKNGDSVKAKQLKVSEESKKYILDNKAIVTFSDKAKKYLDIQ